MATRNELEAGQKQEAAAADEATNAARYYVPCTDVHETEDALVIAMEMPGVAREGVEVTLEKDLLEVTGQVDFSGYEGLESLYTEYRAGHFARRFSLSSTIDRRGISARVDDGVLHLRLPKTREATPTRIEVR